MIAKEQWMSGCDIWYCSPTLKIDMSIYNYRKRDESTWFERSKSSDQYFASKEEAEDYARAMKVIRKLKGADHV